MIPKKYLLWILFIITHTIYFIILWKAIPTLETLGNGFTIFDLKIYYDYEYAVTVLEYLEPTGRAYSLYKHLPWDTLFALFFGITYHQILQYFHARSRAKLRNTLALLPIIGSGSHVLNNGAMAWLLMNFPSVNPNVLWIASVLGLLKVIFIALTLLAFIVSGCWFLRSPSR